MRGVYLQTIVATVFALMCLTACAVMVFDWNQRYHVRQITTSDLAKGERISGNFEITDGVADIANSLELEKDSLVVIPVRSREHPAAPVSALMITHRYTREELKRSPETAKPIGNAINPLDNYFHLVRRPDVKYANYVSLFYLGPDEPRQKEAFNLLFVGGIALLGVCTWIICVGSPWWKHRRSRD